MCTIFAQMQQQVRQIAVFCENSTQTLRRYRTDVTQMREKTCGRAAPAPNAITPASVLSAHCGRSTRESIPPPTEKKCFYYGLLLQHL